MASLTILFVAEGGSKDCQRMIEAFELVNDSDDIDVKWCSARDCLNVTGRESKQIFVFNEFHGDAFGHLVQTKSRLLGPIYILDALKNGRSIPKRTLPLHNGAMENMVVCVTSLPKAQRDECSKRVEWMGGIVKREFHEGVTHLVAGEVGSKKYIVAANLKKPIMAPEWIEEVWNASQNSLINANDAQFSSLTCPIFKGLVISVSGLDSGDRKQSRDGIEREGGQYSGEMKLNLNTHLVTNMPRGAKYEAAKKWHLKIVNTRWLFDSLRIGYCLDETQYPVVDEERDASKPSHSTPNRGRKSSVPSYTNPDISTISVNAVDDSAMTTMNATNLAADSDSNKRKRLSEAVRVVDAFNMKELMSSSCFDGCKIYLSGFSRQQITKLRRVINLGGGTILSQISDAVSHMVIGEMNNEEITLAMSASLKPHVISVQWLLDSCTQRNCMPEESYYCVDMPEANPETPEPANKRRATDRKSLCDIQSTSSFRVNEPPQGTNDMRNLLSQYLPDGTAGQSGTMGESTLIRAAEAGDAAQQHTLTPNAHTNTDSTMQEQNNETSNNDVTMDPDATVEITHQPLLTGKTFVIHGFDFEENEAPLKEFIKCNGGKIQSTRARSVPDYAVVPVFCESLEVTAAEIVTNAWIQMCVEQNCMIPLEHNAIFQPLTVAQTSDPLKDCVLSISGYQGTERDVYVHIAEFLGAVVQDFFVRRANPGKNLRASTHLIVNAAVGNKYQAATKWQLPAVSNKWLVECAKRGKKLDEEQFLIDRVINEDNVDEQDTTSSMHTPKVTRAASIYDVATPTVTPGTKNTPAASRADDVDMVDPANVASKPRTPLVTVMETNVEQPITPVQKPVLKNTRVQELISEREPRAASPTPTTPTGDNAWFGYESPSTLFDPNKPYVPELDFSKALDAMNTPVQHTPGGTVKPKRKPSLSLGDIFADRIQKAVENTEQLALNQDDQPMSQHRAVLNTPEPTPNVGPLHGVVIAVSKKLASQQSECNNIAVSLGADYRWVYDNSCTHFIFQGKANDINKEFRLARDQKKVIVSPSWLHVCLEQQNRIDESLYPHTFNPNKSLTVTPARGTRQSARSKKTPAPVKRTISPPKPSSSTATVKSVPIASMSAASEKTSTTTDANMDVDKTSTGDKTDETLVQNLRKLLASKNPIPHGHIRRSSRNSVELNDSKGSRSASRLSIELENNRSASRRANRRFSPPPDSQTEPSQVYEVGWEDPGAKKQQELLAADLAKNSESFSPSKYGGCSDEETRKESSESEKDEEPPNTFKIRDPMATSSDDSLPPAISSHEHPPQGLPMPKPLNSAMDAGQSDGETSLRTMDIESDVESEQESEPEVTVKKFMLSGLKPQEKPDFTRIIESLGGEISTSGQFDPSCTHLIAGALARNEKLLGCIATGKWVLHKSYVDACQAAGTFVDETDHEWGSPATSNIMESLNTQSKKIARAAHFWRRKLDENRQSVSDVRGAFAEWCVILVTDSSRVGGFKRLLLAGGAEVVATQPPFENLENVTHAFCEMSKVKFQVDLQNIVEDGTLCLKPEYIASCLTESPIPSPDLFVIPEVQRLLGIGADERKRKASGSSTPGAKRSCRR